MDDILITIAGIAVSVLLPSGDYSSLPKSP